MFIEYQQALCFMDVPERIPSGLFQDKPAMDLNDQDIPVLTVSGICEGASRFAVASLPKAAPAHDDISQVKRLETALDNMSQGLCMFDARSRLVLCNRRYNEIFGLEPDAIGPGLTQEEICVLLIARGCYPPEVTFDTIRSGTYASLGSSADNALSRTLADGRVLSVLYRRLPDGGWVSTFEDITERRRSEARIAHLAQHDPLTDLVNARSLRTDSLCMLPPSRKNPVLAVHYLDLDRFKFINDTYGHDIGDELLRAVADRLRGLARRGMHLGRLGGDEFAVLHRTASRETALSFAKRIGAEVSAPYYLSSGRVEIGASIGLATRHGVVTDLEPALQEADLALRTAAKSTSRGSVAVFDPAMSEQARERRRLEADLHQAVADAQFAVHYQPLVTLDTHEIIGAEALLRWHHPERGMVPPATFIPLAEEIGLIVPIGEWVLRRACQEAANWPDHVVIAVNVSSVQMRQKGFSASVAHILAETGLLATRLEIEITETALLDESEIIIQNLNDLRLLGIRFAMDDFGTGYSSLSYLRRFPIDKIKIDRSFVKDAEHCADALAIIRAVAGLGTSLGITTLVEGVETLAQLDLARSEGVRQVQGYLISRPQPAAVITGLLRDGLAPLG